MKLSVTWNLKGVSPLASGSFGRAAVRALRKAGITATRDMKSEASKRIRALKRLKPSTVNQAILISRPKGGAANLITGEWALRMTGKPLPLIEYPHRLVTRSFPSTLGKPRRRKLLMIEVNRGHWTLVPGAFIARMRSGHEGIFRRRGDARLPIGEMFSSRPVDPLLRQGEAEAIATRGGRSFRATFERLLPLELAKGSK